MLSSLSYGANQPQANAVYYTDVAIIYTHIQTLEFFQLRIRLLMMRDTVIKLGWSRKIRNGWQPCVVGA